MNVVRAALLSAALSATACQNAEPSITVGISALRISQPLFVASRERLFARRGLSVRVQSFATAQPLLDEVALGRIDVGGFVAWPIVLLGASRAPAPVHVATNMIEDDTHRVSYALAQRGSRLRFPRDLPGRRVGVLPTIAYRRWLVAIARAASVSPASFSIVPVDPSMQSAALASGAVDLLFTNDPMATAMIQRGVAEVVDDGPPCARRLSPSFSFATVAMSDGFVRRSPSATRRFVAALDDAIAAIQRDPSLARRAMTPFLREIDRPFVDHYPIGAYASSAQSARALADAVDSARRLQIFEGTPNVRAWSP
jgi:ABC-type nitrate/sulfonate/bicarbonate transport system substrate-binding protein